MFKLKGNESQRYGRHARSLRSGTHFDAAGCPTAQARSHAQSRGAVGALPGEAGTAAPKMSVSSGGLVNRAAQIEGLDNSLGRQSKILAYQPGDAFFWH